MNISFSDSFYTGVPEEVGAETVVGEDIDLVSSNQRCDSSVIPESVLKKGLPRLIYRTKCAMGLARYNFIFL